MPAERLFYEKRITVRGAIIEMTMWRVPVPVPPSSHGLNYSLFYGVPGRRLAGFDNERGKGDHKHVGDLDVAYTFSSVRQLIADFLAEVRKIEDGPWLN